MKHNAKKMPLKPTKKGKRDNSKVPANVPPPDFKTLGELKKSLVDSANENRLLGAIFDSEEKGLSKKDLKDRKKTAKFCAKEAEILYMAAKAIDELMIRRKMDALLATLPAGDVYGTKAVFKTIKK